MKILVDFDNVPTQIRKYGPNYVVDRIVAALKPALAGINVDSLDFRFYGGWDENNKMTRNAQELSSNLRAAFPKIINSDHAYPPVPLRLSAILAQSLELLPRHVLPNTIRNIQVQKEFVCTKPSTIGCKTINCPIDPLADFLSSGACPVPNCAFTPLAVLRKREQKLVDTMMVADMIHLASTGEPEVAIISSDDDMWPGILTSLVAGARLIHIQTSGLKTVLPYKKGVEGKYVQLEI